MASYDLVTEQVQKRQLKTERLVIPVLITHQATAANKTITYDEPSLMFLNVEGVSNITLARGAVDSAAELSAITFATATDSTGVFNLLVRMGQPIAKVCSVKLVYRAGNEIVVGTAPTGATSFISSGGDKVVANFDTAENFGSTDGDYTVEIEFAI